MHTSKMCTKLSKDSFLSLTLLICTLRSDLEGIPFGGYPVKSTQIFIGGHLRFFRVTFTRIFSGCSPEFFLINKYETQFFSSCGWLEAKKNIRWHPKKIWVDFTGYPYNHFSGCRLNKRLFNIEK